MKAIKVKLKNRSYEIIIGCGVINSLGRQIAKLNLGTTAYVITNRTIKNKYGRRLNKALNNGKISVRFKLVADSEKSKSIKTASSVIEDITRYDKRRRLFIIAFGGGVVGDLAGFIASIYKRGTTYIQLPTTLLAQVDSSIGGKTAVDLMEGKNLVGAFYQPSLVLSDTNFLRSLPPRQMRCGLAEIIKYAIIKDPELFRYLEKKYQDILKKKNSCLETIVSRCSRIKADIVSLDEKEERGIRTILNFGHTFGHALEAAGGYKGYNHGEAVALGMLVSSGISEKLGLLNRCVAQRIEQLIEKTGLPVKIRGVALKKIIKAYYRDKKFIAGKNKLVLIKNIGLTKIVQDVPLGIIKEALKERLNPTSYR